MAHIHEKIDFCSEVYIVNEGSVLLRMHEKYNMWLVPGGHIELDEDPVEAALREVREEVGLEVSLLGDVSKATEGHEKEILVPQFLNRHPINDTHDHIAFVYFGVSDTREVAPQEGESTEGIRWFTRAEIDDASFGVPPRVKQYAHAALTAAGY